jgi:16S rRNA (guanine527-N7)-methyltransferase
MLAYLELIERWNRAYNLTSVRSADEMLTRHLLDSLSVSNWVPAGRLLDAGTGAGLPAVPLAIARPGLDVIALDSNGKKIRFLRHVRRVLALDNLHPLQARLESYHDATGFDAIISRAFSSLAEFATAARHLAIENTRLLAMKGRRPREEMEALPRWARVESVEELSVPGLQEDRHLVIMSVSA